MSIKDFLASIQLFGDVQIHYMNDLGLNKVVVYDGPVGGALEAVNDGYWHFRVDSIYAIGDKIYINIY